MSVLLKLAPEDQMTIEDFLAFTETRPDDERWELIEGVPVLNAAPANIHQVVTGNILALLLRHKAEHSASWLPTLGIGTRVPVSANSLPQPDVYVSEGPANWDHVTNDALVIFEVLSRSNRKADQVWRRKVYASVPNCLHYVTVALKTATVAVYDRATKWKAREATGLDTSINLAALSVTLPLADVYRYTPVGQS